MKDLDGGTKSVFSMFGSAGLMQQQAGLLFRKAETVEKCTNGNLMKLNEGENRFLNLEHSSLCSSTES